MPKPGIGTTMLRAAGAVPLLIHGGKPKRRAYDNTYPTLSRQPGSADIALFGIKPVIVDTNGALNGACEGALCI